MKYKLLIDDEHKTFTFKGRESHQTLMWPEFLVKTIDGVVPSETKFYKFLESLYEDYFSKGYQLLIDERWEGHCWDFTLTTDLHKKISLSDILIEFKNKYSISHDFFKILNGNLYHYKNSNPNFYQPILFWLLHDTLNQDVLSKKLFTKKFLYLNRVSKNHRVDLFRKIFEGKDDILENSHYSWNAGFDDIDNPNNFPAKSLEGFQIKGEDEDTLLNEPKKFIQDSFCNIVVETDTTEEGLFFSEKIVKPILAKTPFVVLASPNFLTTLKELGFQTFNEWWDESYDLEKNHDKRIEKLYEVITYINSKSLEELYTMYDDMKNVLEHNVNQYKLLRSINNKLTTYPKAFHNMDFNYIGVDREEELKQHYRIEEHETM